MKHSELTVGASYYYDRSTAWGKYARGCRAVVLSDGQWAQRKDSWAVRRPEPFRVEVRGGVLVDIYYGVNGDIPVREVVPAAHLRGPWEQTCAQVAEWERQRRIASAEETGARLDASRARAQAMKRASNLGVTVSTNGTELVIAVDDLLDVLDRLEGTTR